MLVCDICKANVSNKKEYYVPMYTDWISQINGITVETFVKLEDCNVNLCQDCKVKLANFLNKMKQ
jgi:hypothetical protein